MTTSVAEANDTPWRPDRSKRELVILTSLVPRLSLPLFFPKRRKSPYTSVTVTPDMSTPSTPEKLNPCWKANSDT